MRKRGGRGWEVPLQDSASTSLQAKCQIVFSKKLASAPSASKRDKTTRTVLYPEDICPPSPCISHGPTFALALYRMNN